jgi:hypothetical protein
LSASPTSQRDLHEVLRDTSRAGGDSCFDYVLCSNVPDYTNYLSLCLDVRAGSGHSCKAPTRDALAAAMSVESVNHILATAGQGDFMSRLIEPIIALRALPASAAPFDNLLGTRVLSNVLLARGWWLSPGNLPGVDVGDEYVHNFLFGVTRLRDCHADLPALLGTRLLTKTCYTDMVLRLEPSRDAQTATPPSSVSVQSAREYLLSLAAFALLPGPVRSADARSRTANICVNAFTIIRVALGMSEHASAAVSALESMCSSKRLRVADVCTSDAYARRPATGTAPTIVNFFPLSLDITSALAVHGSHVPIRHAHGFECVVASTSVAPAAAKKTVTFASPSVALPETTNIWGCWTGVLLVHRSHARLAELRTATTRSKSVFETMM